MNTVFGKDLMKKSKKVKDKFVSCRKNFRKKEERITADLSETGRIWREMGEKFRWWQTLP